MNNEDIPLIFEETVADERTFYGIYVSRRTVNRAQYALMELTKVKYPIHLFLLGFSDELTTSY